MQIDLKNVRVSYTVKEVALTLAFIAGLVAHVIRTELQDSQLQAQIVDVRRELADCKTQLAQRTQRGEQ